MAAGCTCLLNIYDFTAVREPVIVQLISYRAVLIISIVVITRRLVVHTLTYPIVFTALPMSEAKRAIKIARALIIIIVYHRARSHTRRVVGKAGLQMPAGSA